MDDFHHVSIEEAISTVLRKPGIVIGGNATLKDTNIDQVAQGAYEEVISKSGVSIESTASEWQGVLDELEGASDEVRAALKEEILLRIRRTDPSRELGHLIQAGWSVCVSLTYDTKFEEAVKNHLDSLPSARSATIVDALNVYPDNRTFRIYKLLGNANVGTGPSALSLSNAEVIMRQRIWPNLLCTLPDCLMDAPLLFIGTDATPALTRELLSVLATIPPPRPKRLLFMDGDSSLADGTTRSLLREYRVEIVDASIREFCDALATLTPRQSTFEYEKETSEARQSFAGFVRNHESHFIAVPSALPIGYDPAQHRTALVDGLFRPSSPDWRPYLAGWDLRRSCTTQVVDSAIEALTPARSDRREAVVVVRGEAGVGKTAVMKRAAVELAAQDYGVLWLPRTFTGGTLREIRRLAHELEQERRKKKGSGLLVPEMIVFCDDPWYVQVPVDELVACFEGTGLRVSFVTCFRNTDYFTSEGIGGSVPGRPYADICVPEYLDDNEMRDLPRLLVDIGAATDTNAAESAVSNAATRAANDVLCSLWYLVPETRGMLADSLRDEYRRLGTLSEAVGGIATEISTTSSVARRAYEAVTVGSALKVGVPIEVLVSCLNVDYSEWIEVASEGRPLWGLLYDSESSDGSTIMYHTRNHIVTNVLIELVNGGVGHAGEVAVLKGLIRGCDSGAPVYRNFIVDVLVNRRGELERRISYDEGVELYEMARAILPFDDRLLEHHLGVWMTHWGVDRKSAYEQLNRALQTEVYPGSERDAPREHIHTSMAANIVQLVKEGQQDPETGLETIKEHLRHGSSPSFFSAHNAHVGANTLFEFSQIMNGETNDEVRLESYAEALQEIERALQALGHRWKGGVGSDKDVEIFTDLQKRILAAIPDVDELEETAYRIFSEHANQVGFEVIARKMLASASATGKGTEFNRVRQKLEELESLVESNGGEISPELRAVRVDLVVRWRVQKFQSVDWGALREDLEHLLASHRFRNDVVKQFYHCVALFHCGEIPRANAGFSDLRRLRPASLKPGAIRCYFLGPEGHPKRMQCTVEKEHGRRYASIPELGADVLLSSSVRDIGSGGTSHVWIGFALNGPVAVTERPEPGELQLPIGA